MMSIMSNSSKTKTKPIWEIITLRYLLIIYIVLCILIAGLNFGYAAGATEEVREVITKVWHLYENQFKTLLIIVGCILTLRISKSRPKLQRRNLMGFTIAALVIHICGPILTSNPDLYFFSMPLPWSTIGLQAMIPKSNFYQSHLPYWGVAGMTASVIVFWIINGIVFIGTLLLGRRLQCSHLCLFNGFISETFSPVFPVLGKGISQKLKKLKSFLRLLKWALLILAVLFVIVWLYSLLSGRYNESILQPLSDVEVYKYLSLELLFAMFLWVVFTGRGYCYYCPLGTVLGYISKLSGQRIDTDKSKCLECGKCNRSCPMDIEIMESAIKKECIRDNLCVGCGHCIDTCPTETLEYSTNFLKYIRRDS